MIKHFLFVFLTGLVFHTFAQTPKPVTPPTDLNQFLKPAKWRNIGPFRGGRSVAVSGVPGDPATYYMGTTGGGLWKTEDMGISWSNISDGFFQTGSVGAVAVSESDPNVVYVGMGEHAVRGVMTHHGDGIYKSTDAGKNWKKLGLDQSQHIARIIVHPSNPDIAWAAVQGALYSSSKQRGIYKTTDGGQSWKNVLFVDEKTGCGELSIDHNNPRILYAAMWEYGRLPWKVISGGPGGGLYKSVDGGESWQKMEEGLPKEMGKMSVAVCRSNSDKVYALIESDSEKEAGGLFVSGNAGKNWSRVSADHRLVQRAWYYIEMFPDPNNENTVYVLSAPMLRSEDGGKTWELMNGPHGDYHDMWINPRNSKNFVIADDGGAGITFNYGKSWSSQANMPTAQLYRINVDNEFPYRIYAGQQDNTSVVIAHRELGGYGISTASWEASAGGESAFLAFDPDNPRYVLGGSYLGTIEVLDTKAHAGTNIMAAPIQYLARDAKDMKYRYNWNAPIIWSKHEPNTYYHAAQVLLKTQDMGKTWKEVSPDLTRNEKAKQGKGGGPYTNEAVGAENYGTISYVVESPHEKGVIWTGSDDGLVQLTTDGGTTWKNVSPEGLQECLINAIEVSPHDKATAYIATTRYKFNDHAPGIYKTTDYGKTWTKITNGLPANAFTRVVREDEVRKDLLLAGTEIGLFASWDGGKNWQSFQLNLPITPITDLKIHQGDLIAATSGRSFWIFDDMNLLREYKKDMSGFFAMAPEPSYLANGGSPLNSSDENFKGMGSTEGVNPANGVVLYYHLPEELKDGALKMEIRDSEGNLVKTFSSKADSSFQEWDGGPSAEPVLSAKKGLNRFVWNMRYPTMAGIPNVYYEASFSGHKAMPGKYSIKMALGDKTVETTAEILPNPLYSVSADDYRTYHRFMQAAEAELHQMHLMVNELYAKKTQLEELLAGLPAGDAFKTLKTDGEALAKKITAWDEEMVQRKSKAYDDVENFPNKFTAEYIFLINMTESDLPRVNQPSVDRKAELDAQWTGLKARGRELLDKDLAAYNEKLWKAGIGGIWKK